MQSHFSFAVFPVNSKEECLELERAIIATIAYAFPSSSSWLGSSSPIKKIRESGLWLVQGLDSEPIKNTQFTRLCQLIEN